MKFLIETAPRRFSKTWKPIEITWEKLKERLSQVTYTSETAAEYRHFSKQQRDDIKDIGGYVGGYLEGGIRKKANVKSRSLVTLDADNANDYFLEALSAGIGQWAYAVYSTHSHTKAAPRYRIIIPLAKEVNPDAYIPLARMLAYMINIEAMDDTTYEPERLMYWPSTSKDGEFFFDSNDGSFLDPDEILSRYRNWRDATLWPTSSREAEVRARSSKMQGDPLERPGLIGAFNRTYTITAAIEKFLPGVYTEGSSADRWTYTKGTTANGLVIYDNDTLAYSHHATDPTSGKLCNAFDLVRLHRYGDLDEGKSEDTPTAKLPSYQKMLQLVHDDQKTMEEYSRTKTEKARKEFEKTGANTDWMSKFQMSRGKNPEPLPNAYNFLLILRNDPLLKGKMALDEFAHKAVAFDPLPWTKEKEGKRPWQDDDDSCLRNYLSLQYGLSSRQVVGDVVDQIMRENAFNPVLDYLNGLTWDGVKRADTLFIDFLGAEDSHYVRMVTHIQLLAVVSRVMQPGIKYDQCLVLSGPQGIGKSWILRALGRDHYNDSVTTFVGKEALVQLQDSTIIELSEMQASNKAENDQIKAFISRTTDRFRMPYGRRMASFPRTCTFWGTTNDYVFLKDRTGNRRFWPIYCTGKTDRSLSELTPEFIDQVWAEVLSWYKKDGAKLLPDKETMKEAREVQMAHTEGSEKVGIIKEYLDKKLPDAWQDMDLFERREYLRNYDPKDPNAKNIRTKVCNLEIWCEAFENDKSRYIPSNGREFNAIMMSLPDWEPIKITRRFGELYGQQRGFQRIKYQREQK